MVPMEKTFLPKITWPNSGRARKSKSPQLQLSALPTRLSWQLMGDGVRREALNWTAKADVEV